MHIYFNDLSCSDAGIILADNFDRVVRFFDLIELLNKDFGLVTVIIDGSIGGLRICDTLIGECDYKPEFFDKLNLITSLVNYLNTNVEVVEAHVFLHTSTGSESVLLGNAHEYSRPAISFTFKVEFEASEIVGLREKREARICNLYDRRQITDGNPPFRPEIFISRQDCRGYNPCETPLWNSEANHAYHKRIQGVLNSIKKHPEENIAILNACADTIARLNGWEFDKGLTDKNKTHDKFRRIYRAAKFSRIAYLSIDFEKPEIFFELHDKKGRHLGEYKWNGNRSGEADASGKHNIRVF